MNYINNQEILFNSLINKKYKCLCLDLDGTIIINNKIDLDILQSIKKLLYNGVPIIISTGRLPERAINLFMEFSKLELNSLYISYSNGGLIAKIKETSGGFENLKLLELQVEDMSHIFLELTNNLYFKNKLLLEGNSLISESHKFGITLQFKEICHSGYNNTLDINILLFINKWLNEKGLSNKYKAILAGKAIDIGPINLGKGKSLDLIIDIINTNSNIFITGEQIARIGDMGEKGQNDYEIIGEGKGFTVGTGNSSGVLFDENGIQVCGPKATYEIIKLLNFDLF